MSLPQKGRTAPRQQPERHGTPSTGAARTRLGKPTANLTLYNWYNWTLGTGTPELGSCSDRRWRCLVLLMDLNNLVLLEGEETQQEHKSLPQYISHVTVPAILSSRAPLAPQLSLLASRAATHSSEFCPQGAWLETGWETLVHHPDPPPHQPPKEPRAATSPDSTTPLPTARCPSGLYYSILVRGKIALISLYCVLEQKSHGGTKRARHERGRVSQV